MSARLLTIAADLSAPPSSPSVFRDVTLFGSCRGYEVVAVVDPETMYLPYSRWFASHGLFDYLTDLIPERELRGTSVSVDISGGPTARLTAHSLHAVLAFLR